MLELFVYAAPGGDFLHTRKGGIFVTMAHPIDLFLNHLSVNNNIFHGNQRGYAPPVPDPRGLPGMIQ